MFPREHKDLSYISEARRICRQCDVRKECLDFQSPMLRENHLFRLLFILTSGGLYSPELKLGF